MGAKAVRVAIERIFIRLFAVEGDLGIVGYVVTIDTFGFVIKIVFVNSPIVLYPCEIEEGSLLFLFLRLVPFAFPLAIYIFDFLFIFFFFVFCSTSALPRPFLREEF